MRSCQFIAPVFQSPKEHSMASASNPSVRLSTVGIEEVSKKWGWFLALGIVLIAGGSVAVGSAFIATLFSMKLLGWLMISGGVLQAVHTFRCREWSGFFVELLTGLLYVVMGFMIVANPGATAVTLTLLISMFLMFGGIFRILVALVVKFQNWGWLLLHGVVNLGLGIFIWNRLPEAGLWMIGLFIGIDMMLNGWSLVMLGLTAKNLPAAIAARGESSA
jgi:uncharacterized membrane protein HdeD (DUF308 family)